MSNASSVPPIGWNAVDHAASEQKKVLRQAFDYSVKTNPDSFAEANRMARQAGQPVAQVAEDPEAVRSLLQRRHIESAEFQQKFPVLSKSLQDVKFLTMVRDDLGNLETTEGMLDWATRSWRVARGTSRRGTIGTVAGIAGRKLTAFEQREVDRIDELSQAHSERDSGFTGAAIELLGSMVDTAGTALVAGAATTAVGAPAAAPFVAGTAAFAQSMRLEAGNLYVDLIKQGYTPSEARPLAGLFGAAIGAVDVVGLKLAAKPFKETAGALLPKVFARGLTPQTRTLAFKEALKSYGKSLAAEPTTEALQEVISMAAKDMARVQYSDNPDSEFDMSQAVHAFTHTLKGMVVLGGLGAGGHYVADLRKAGDAQHTARVFQAQAEALAESKVADRSPDTRAEFVNEKVAGTPMETVFLRADKAVEVLRQAEAAEAEESGRSSVMESLEQLMPGLAEQIETAAENGSDVAISNGDFDAKLAKTDIGRAFMDHATFDADGMTANEARMWESQREAEAEHYRAQSEENMARDEELAASAREVEDVVYQQLQATGVLSAKDARASSQFYRDFVVTQAADLDITPGEFYARYPLKVLRGAATEPAGAFHQDGQRKTGTPEFKAWFGDSKAIDGSGAPLVVFRGDPDASWTEWLPAGKSRGDHQGGALFATSSPELASDYAFSAASDSEVQDLVAERDAIRHRAMEAHRDSDIAMRDSLQAKAREFTERIVSLIGDGGRASTGGGVHPLYLALRNPLTIDAKGQNHRQVNEEAIAAAREGGRDGVIIKNVVDNARVDRGPQDVYVAFDPTQIKSVNNRGTFDKNDPNILRQDEEAEGEAPRGEFLPHELTVLLGEKADASTFLHESAHYFLTVYADLAAQPGAPARVQLDMDKLLESFGVEDVTAWNAMTLEQQREHHETFAYQFEQYLFDGKAPSSDLRPLFQRFSSWLRRLYRGIRDNLNKIYRREFGKDLPILTGEVRGVMDRMLASEEQIAAAEHVRGMVPMFQTQEESGMNDAAWEAYQEHAGKSHDEAIDALTQKSLANMKWLQNARAKVLKEKQAEAAETRAAVRVQAKADVEQEPVYKASHYLKRGETRSEDGTATAVEGPHKLDNETVQQMLGKPLPKPRKKRRQSLATFVREKGGIAHSSWTTTYPGETKGEFRISGVFRGKPKPTAARGTSGMPWDQMAVLARENGYGPSIDGQQTIENEDHTWFIDAMQDAANGNHIYTEEAVDADAEAQVSQESETRAGLLKRLGYGKYGMLQNEGLDPQRVADAFGFPSGQALLDALLAAPSISEAIDAETDRRMLAEHSDLVDPEQIRLAVEAAVHNEARAKFVTIELKALAKITQPTRLMTEAAKEAARQILATKTLREIRPRDFSIAEARHGREAFKAIQAGDTAAAIVAKQKQLVQFHLAKQAAEAQLEVQKGNKEFRRVFKSDTQLAKTRDVNIIQAARAVLTLYDLGKASRNPMEWLKPVQGHDPETFADIAGDVQFAIDQSARLDGGNAAVPAKWKSLSLEQYRDLRETIDALWQKSRRTKQVLIDGKRQSREAYAARAVEQIESLPAKKRLAGNRTAGDDVKEGATSYLAQARRAEFVMRDLDGGKPGVFTALFRRIKEAANAFREMARAELKTYEDRLRDHDFGPNVAIDGVRFLVDGNAKASHGGVFKNKAELLGVMQHLGNASNKKKALVSEGWAELYEDGTLDTSVWDAFESEMVRTGVLVQADYDLLQAIWDQNESHKAALQKAHYENHGYHWREIEAQTLTVTFPDGTEARYRGGYVPAKADPKRVPLAAKQEVDTKAAAQSSLPMVQRGFTKERSETYIEPLSHDLNDSGRHLVEVLRYVHMQSAATDVNRILTHKSVTTALQNYNPAILRDVLTPWLKRSAVQQVGEVGASNPAFRMMARVASNTNMGIMFGNVGNSLQNFTGLTEAMTAAKPRHVLGALASYIGNRKAMTATALEKSSELRGRKGRQMIEVRNEIKRQVAGAGKVRRALDWVRENAYFMQQITQDVVDTVVWTAVYNQHLARGPGAAMAEVDREAVRRADAAVRQTQMATDPEDVSEWEAQGSGAGGFIRALFPFQSWFIRWGNNQVSNWKNPAEAGGRAAAVIYGYALPMILAQLVSDAVNGRLEDEDDDGWGDEAAELTLRSLVGGSLAAVPIFGKPVASVANTFLDDEVWNDRMPAPPFIEAFERARRAISANDFDQRDASDLASFFGNMVGLPVGAVLSRFTYATRAAQGETKPGGPLGETFDTVRGLVTGRGR